VRTSQRIVLIVYILCFLFLSVIYVPYTAKLRDDYFHYYSSLWSPRSHPIIRKFDESNSIYSREWSIKVDTSLWSIEIITLSVICGVAFVLFRKSKEKESGTPPC
jgi:hypothetical protein